MQATSTDRKTFQLTENEQLLGEIVYENLFLLKAEIKLPNADYYEIKPIGFFGTSLSVTKQGGEIANLKMNWRGQIVFSFYDGQEFVLKSKGIFNNKFLLENQDEVILLQFEPKFIWSKFNYNYDIHYDEKPKDILLVLLGVYACNYYISVMSGSAS